MKAARLTKSLISIPTITLVLGFGLTTSANAALITGVEYEYKDQGQMVTGTGSPFVGNDCAGVLGGNFGECEYNGSPIIIKYDVVTGGFITEINDEFPSVDGSEFVITFDTGTTVRGTWYYLQGEDDPDVVYYVAKGGNEFNLFDMTVSESVVSNVGCDLTLNGVTYTQCADWNTPGQGLSHLSFYDNGGGDQTEVPEPGVLFLMGAGLLGVGMARRRKSA